MLIFIINDQYRDDIKSTNELYAASGDFPLEKVLVKNHMGYEEPILSFLEDRIEKDAELEDDVIDLLFH